MKLLSSFLIIASLIPAFAAQTPPDYRFKTKVLHTGTAQPMHLEIAPDGQIYFIEIAGKLRRLDPNTGKVTELAHLKVTNEQENGLIGMALDPNFAKNQNIFLYHSPVDFKGQVLSRYTVKGDTLDLSTRVDVIKVPEQRNQCCHHGGTVRFSPDGLLYLSTGDNTSPFASDGFTPIDERDERAPFDAQKSSGNTNDLRGKILRIKIHPDGSYTIPEGNLFPMGTEKTKAEIYAMGFRNPWRFAIDPETGWLYVGDVGPDSGRDKDDRGPRGHDILYQIRKAGNFGWPYLRAKLAYRDFDFEKNISGPAFDPAGPVNESPNNTGLKKLPPVLDPLVYYPHASVEKFKELGSGGRTSCGGPVFHFKPDFEKSGGFPEYFDGAVLHFDWQRPFLVWVRLKEDGSFKKLEPFSKALDVRQGESKPGSPLKLRRPADMTFGPDGALYILDYGETWGANKNGRIVKVSYRWGELPPIVKLSADNSSGPVPLKVKLDASSSYSLEKKDLDFAWHLLPGETPLGTGPILDTTLSEPGDHIIRVTVTDSTGNASTREFPITAGNSAPVVTALNPSSRTLFKPGQKISYAFQVTDAEEGSSDDDPTNFDARTLVTATWLDRAGKKLETNPGLSLMKQSDCFNCHAIDQKLIGPSFMEIAELYRGKKGAQLISTERVIKGSAGVWGEVPMLPHPQNTMDEAHLMVSWIFGLDPKKPVTAMARGLRGEITAPTDPKIGSCILEATFTDLGKAPASPLTTSKTVTLLHHRIEAESAILHGPTLASQNEASNDQSVNRIEPGRSIEFPALTLDGRTEVTVRAASSHDPGSQIEVRSGSKTGSLLATIEVKKTGGNHKYQEFTAPFTVPERNESIHFIFTSKKKGRLMFLDWIEFN